MADLPNNFWSGWIIVITTVSLLGLVWLVITSYFFQNESEQGHGSEEGPVWDETLREGNTAPPLWRFWLILGTMIFSVAYLMLYPGMGAWKGMLEWSQDSRLESSYDNYNDQFLHKREAIAQRSIADLQNDVALMDTAQGVFARNCVVCHGPGGRGQASLFPNLKDIDWQWGGTPEQIEQTIRQGRIAGMAGWQGALGDQGVAQVTEYVLTMADKSAEPHPGKGRYLQFCAVCHGAEGDGNEQLGTPKLNDNIWLYGGSFDDVRKSIAEGRQGIMPAFEERLDDAQIKLLVAWLAR